MISETAYSSPTKLIGLNLHVGEQGIGYSNVTPDPKGGSGVKKKKNCLSGGARKTREAGFLVYIYREQILSPMNFECASNFDYTCIFRCPLLSSHPVN